MSSAIPLSVLEKVGKSSIVSRERVGNRAVKRRLRPDVTTNDEKENMVNFSDSGGSGIDGKSPGRYLDFIKEENAVVLPAARSQPFILSSQSRVVASKKDLSSVSSAIPPIPLPAHQAFVGFFSYVRVLNQQSQ